MDGGKVLRDIDEYIYAEFDYDSDMDSEISDGSERSVLLLDNGTSCHENSHHFDQSEHEDNEGKHGEEDEDDDDNN
jgi:hypothetical protein